MKIETKINVGAAAWFIHNNKVTCRIVKCVNIHIDKPNTHGINENYYFVKEQSEATEIHRNVTEVFKSKQELLDSL